MDISYLLFLQNFRESTHNALTPFLEWVSHFAVAYLIIIPVFIYWCISKRKGLYILCSACITLTVNSVVKLTACIYRPWIRDARIVPAGDAIKEATGYSFPSGHAASATPVYAGITAVFGKKNKIVGVICILMLALTAFSRNYLGVHTPQDVLVGLCEGLVILYLTHRVFLYLESHPEKENYLLLLGVALAVAGLVYITLKTYPMEYVDGKLLVDPKAMMTDGYKDVGMFLAFCVGRFIEKTWIRFEEAGVNAKGILVSVLGIIPLYAINKLLPPVTAALCGEHLGGMAARAALVLYAMDVWPIVIKLVCKKKNTCG